MSIFSSLLVVWTSLAPAQVPAVDDADLPHGAVARLGSMRLRPGGPVESVAWSGDGRHIVSVSTGEFQSHLQLWDAATGRLREQFPVGRAAVLSPDGRRVLHAQVNRFGIAMRDLATGKSLWAVEGSLPAAFAADGRTLIYFRTPQLILADADTGKEIRAFARINSVRDAVWAIALAREGGLLAALHDDDTVRLWDISTGKEVRQIQAAGVTSLAYAPDGKTLALGGPTVRLFDLSDGHVCWERDEDDVCTRLVFAPDGRSLATGHRDGSVRLLDATSGKQLRRCGGHGSRIWGVDFAPDGRTLVSCGEDGVVRRWKTSTGEPFELCDGLPGCAVGLAISPDGRGLTTADSKGRLALWRSDMPSPRALVDENRRLTLLGYRPDGMLVTTVDREINYRDGQTGRLRKTVPLGKPVLAWSAEKALVVCGIYDLTVVDGTSGKLVHAIEDRTGNSVALAADGRTLVQGGMSGPTRFDVASGKKLDNYEHHPQDVVRSNYQVLLLSADARFVVGGDIGGEMRLFSMDEGWRLMKLQGVGGFGVPAIAPDGRFIAAGRRDGTVCVWEVASGALFAELPGHRGSFPVVAFFPDGRRLASSGGDGTILIWDWLAAKSDAPDLFHKKDREPLWDGLAAEGADGVNALGNLLASGDEGVDWLRGKVKPTPGLTLAQINRLLEQIDDEDFNERQAASAALMTHGRQVEPTLRRFLLVGKPSLEAARRIEEVLEGWDRERDGNWLNKEERRITRAIHALEYCGSPAARRLLTVLAGGGEGAVMTREAKASLARLAARPSP